MTKRFLTLIAFLTILLCATMNAQWTAGFYAAGNGVEPYSSIPWSMYTSVVHFAATPGSNGTVSLGYLTQSDISSFIASRPSGKKAILCISDAPGGSFANNTTSSLVGTFASNIANFVNSNGYDGVDFDWEQNVNVTQFNTFLQQMRSALPGKLITTDMGNWNSLQSVAAASQSYLDQINIMCYDLDYSAGYSWYVDAVLQAGNTSVMTCDWRVNAFTSAGVAASKIGVGMPFYGRVYSGVTAAQQSSGNGSTVLYRNLVTNSSYWQPQYQGYDSAHKGQYLSIPSPATWISYTGTEEIGDIVSWAKSKGYGGYMTYSLDYEYLSSQSGNARYPLSTALYNAVGGTTQNPPVVSGGAPTGTLASSTTQTSMSVVTNENATCHYATTAGTAYASMPYTFAITGGTSHSVTLTGLTEGSSYNYYVRCSDASGDVDTSDYTVSFSVAKAAPPVVTNGAPTGSLASTTTSTTMSATTNENATCKYATTAGTAYASMPNTFATTGGTAQSTTVTGLTAGSSYSYYLRCSDASGDVDTTDYTISFSVANPPVVSNGAPTGSLASTTTSTTMSATTNVSATCKYSTTAGTAYASMPNTFATTGGMAQSTTLTGLTAGSSYTYYVRCSDPSGDVDTTDYPISFSIAQAVPPVVSNGAPSGSLASTTTQTTMSATTNENATCKYSTVPGTAYASMPNTFSVTGGTSQSILLTGLTAGGNYGYYVRCSDASGNADTTDYPISFSVSQAAAPVISNGAPSGSLAYTTTSTTMSATTNVNATCKYSTVPGTAYASMPNTFSTTGGTAQSILLTGLTAGGNYGYYVRCSGSTGNVDTTDYPISFTVASTPPPVAPPVVSNGAPSGMLDSTMTSVTMSAATNENATCKYATTAGMAYASMPYTFSATGGTTHSSMASGLTSGSSYNYYVRCSDASGNVDTTDYPISFSVAAAPSSTQPPPAGPLGENVSPNSGSGDTQTFVIQITDSKGYSHVSQADVVFGAVAANSCYVDYWAPTRLVSLRNSANTGWTSATLGAATTLQNNDCVVNVGAATVSGSGTLFTLNLPMMFKSVYAGAKTINTFGADSGGTTTGWKTSGTWTVQ